MSASETDRILGLLDEFYTPDEASRWLAAPQPLLGGRSAADLIHEGRTAEVERLLQQLRDGVYL